MDEEEMEPQQQMPPVLRVAALTMTGEFFLIMGALFVLLGIADFLTDFLKVKGSGDAVVGVFLVLASMALFALSRTQMPKPVPRPPVQEMGPSLKDQSGSYR